MSLRREAIVEICWYGRGTTYRSACAVIAWDWTMAVWANWMKATLISPFVKGGELSGACYILASSSSGGTCSPRRGAPTLVVSFSSLCSTFLRVFILPIIAILRLDVIAHYKYTLTARYMIFKKMRSFEASCRFQSIRVVRFTIMNMNSHRRGRDKHQLLDNSTSCSDTMFVTSRFTPYT